MLNLKSVRARARSLTWGSAPAPVPSPDRPQRTGRHNQGGARNTTSEAEEVRAYTFAVSANLNLVAPGENSGDLLSEKWPLSFAVPPAHLGRNGAGDGVAESRGRGAGQCHHRGLPDDNGNAPAECSKARFLGERAFLSAGTADKLSASKSPSDRHLS